MFTASNPGIPAGGLVGESKSQILDSFQTEREVIARYRLINFSLSLNEKVSQAVHFMSEIETSFPIVLKPDAGERSASVAIIKSKSEATDIYDPKNSIWHAYKVLMKQWKIAFEIGALNVKRGQKTVPLIKFLGLLFRS